MVASAVSLGSQATLLLQPPASSLSAVAIPGHTSPPNPWPRTDIVSRFVARDAFATQVNQSDQPSNSGLCPILRPWSVSDVWQAISFDSLTLRGLDPLQIGFVKIRCRKECTFEGHSFQDVHGNVYRKLSCHGQNQGETTNPAPRIHPRKRGGKNMKAVQDKSTRKSISLSHPISLCFYIVPINLIQSNPT
jgi:hypothetical protein